MYTAGAGGGAPSRGSLRPAFWRVAAWSARLGGGLSRGPVVFVVNLPFAETVLTFMCFPPMPCVLAMIAV